MKRTLIVAAISMLATGAALAQSSVTIYGRLNVTAESQKLNGVKTSQLNNNSSRIGFKGSEDLGGGLRAGFQLESGFDVSTGAAASSFFGRRSEVNLSGEFGKIRLGNFFSDAYYATADYISNHNHDTGRSADALYAYIGRNGNKIAYATPEFVKGLSLQGSVSAGEGAPGQKRSYDFAANYTLGALQLGLGYEKNDSIKDAKQVAFRAAYEFGPVVLGAYIQRDTNGFGAGLGDRTTYRLSGMYTLGASEFHVNAGRAGDYDKAANSSAKQYTLGYNYNLSKRTKVYTYVTKIDAGKATINNDGKTLFYGGDSSSVAVGVRHNF